MAGWYSKMRTHLGREGGEGVRNVLKSRQTVVNVVRASPRRSAKGELNSDMDERDVVVNIARIIR